MFDNIISFDDMKIMLVRDIYENDEGEFVVIENSKLDDLILKLKKEKHLLHYNYNKFND